MRLLALSALLGILLSACDSTPWNPSYMPSGYTHHHEMYKTPDGPETNEGDRYAHENPDAKYDASTFVHIRHAKKHTSGYNE